MRRVLVVSLAVVSLAGCATGRSMRRAETAERAGNWDTAVAYYREVLGQNPDNVDAKMRLQRATQTAVAEHVKRARELEGQEQFAAAAAEYRVASQLDPSNSFTLSKASEIERRLRDQAEAARPQPRLDTLRQQAAQSSPIPRLDPRTRVPQMRYQNTAIRDLLRTVSDLTGLNITYDRGLDAALSAPYSFNAQDMPLEDVLVQILQANQLTFKVVSPQAIFVYQDTQQKRQQFEDQYLQTFYLSNADPAELTNQLQQVFAGVQIANRPVFTQNKASNTLTVRATGAVMPLIENIVRANDRPQAEVFIEGEVLEVDRSFIRQLGLDLSQWALGFTFSPEVVPPNTSGTFPPATPPPFSINSLKGGPQSADFFMTSPTALIKLLESNSNTKVLARPSQRGRAGQQIALRLGDQVPIPQTVFQSAAAGGVANVPTTSVAYQSVGVNLLFTPRVTYKDEIILDQLTLEKSGLGGFLDVGGQSFPTIVTRQAQTSLGLRDGESTLIAGLLRDDDRRTYRSLPGLSRLPILNQIFGNSDRQVDQTEIVMIITARIVRGHDITADDLKPMFIGTGSNIGGGAPQLISPEALAAASSGLAPGIVAGSAGSTAGGPVGAAGSPADAPRAPGVVAIQPVVPGTPTGAQIAIAPPAEGSASAGGGPYTMPIQIRDVTNLASVSLSITYNPSVMASIRVGQGSFMSQGNVSPTFTQAVDAAAGRIDMAFARPASQPGASGSGLLAAIAFTGGMPGTATVVLSGVATTATGQTIPLTFTPATVVVR